MAVTILEGGTFRMLIKDKRVGGIAAARDGKRVASATEEPNQIEIVLKSGWQSGGDTSRVFDDWESGRNWVRKAVNLNEKAPV